MRRLVSAALIAAVLVLCGSASSGSAQGPQPYRILVTNDDGVRSPGLAALVQALAPLGEIAIVAPTENQSGTGHAITLNDPIYTERVDVAGKSATGLLATPATCVRVALSKLLQARPDLIVSGVNRGSNFGLNAYISGTVAAAREGAMQGVPSIAASLEITGHPNYGPAAAATAAVAEIVKQGGLPKGIFLNLNVPAGPNNKGLKLVKQSATMGTERFDELRTPYGRPMLWSFFQQPTSAEPDSDVQAALDGYVAVTPLMASEFSPTAFELLKGRIK
jgi:5'-nucleotidase